MRRILVGPLAASAAIASFVIGSATVASATHTVELGDTASLLAKGAAVVVPVEVTCSAGDPFPTPFPPLPPFPGSGVSVSITQRAGNRIAQGFGSANVVCDGNPHIVEVRINANQAPFKAGSALVTATMTQCVDFTNCHTASDTEEIRIRH